MTDVYCAMIHGGLNLNFRSNMLEIQSCCLQGPGLPVDKSKDLWKQQVLLDQRQQNQKNIWSNKCSNCQQLEQSGHSSMRTGMNQGLDVHGRTNLSGPARIDLMFDISCNLACRTCGPHASTFWQKHLKEHNRWKLPIFNPRRIDEVIHSLQQLDLSNLRQIVFCGGETMLGQSYWNVANWLADNVPNAKNQLTVCFQTNGTQSILEQNIETIQKLYLVKLHISLDGVGRKFEYLRWPADWAQVTDNILHLKQTAPSNVMFLVEETISIFNLLYTKELTQWVQTHFVTNKEGDIINHTKHLATGDFSLANCSAEYVAAMSAYSDKTLIPPDWTENEKGIKRMIASIKTTDQFRAQSFEKTFPELAECYKRYLT